jgi:hypothetical protein
MLGLVFESVVQSSRRLLLSSGKACFTTQILRQPYTANLKISRHFENFVNDIHLRQTLTTDALRKGGQHRQAVFNTLLTSSRSPFHVPSLQGGTCNVARQYAQGSRHGAQISLFNTSGSASQLGRWQLSRSRRYFSSIPPSSIVYGLLAANLGVYALWQIPSASSFMYKHFVLSQSHIRLGYYHTLFTHAVSHQALDHLFMNMFTFYFFGTSLANYIGGVRVCFLCASSLRCINRFA